MVLGFAAALLVAYLIGFYNVETKQALSLWEKGLTKFAIHFAFLAAGVAYLARRSERFYWRTLGWFAAGFAANAAYGVLQLVATLGGRNLDALVLNPITGGASSINIWGAVGQSSVYRVNALTGDANHLGVMLVVPLLLLTPVYLRLEPGTGCAFRSRSCSASCSSSSWRRSRGADCWASSPVASCSRSSTGGFS